MWRNPLTNRFESGNPPEQQQQQQTDEGFAVQEEGSPAAIPTAQRGGRWDGGWDYVPVAGQDADGKGGEVMRVVDVLGVESLDVKDSHAQTGNIGPEPASTNDGPIGQGGSGSPRG
jgi:hypothetical protein